MHLARLSLLACGLLLAQACGGQAQAPPAPVSAAMSAPNAVPVTVPASAPDQPGPTTPAPLPPIVTAPSGPAAAPPPVSSSASPASGMARPLPDSVRTPPPAETPPPTETPLPGSGDNPAFAGNPSADPSQSVVLDNADRFEQITPNLWTGRGHVRVRYKGYVLTGDRVDVDTDRGLATFTGHVHLVAPNGQTVDAGPAGKLNINLRRGTYTLTGARSVITPEQTPTQIGLILPLYVYGGVVRGRPGLIDARGGHFTTCDFLDPHYSFTAREAYIIPGKRLVGRNVSFFRKNQRLFTIPYVFFPLDQRLQRQTLFPEVGQTPDEGYYIKFALGYALATSLPGILRIDEFQKKGTGLGFDQTYGSAERPTRGSGLFTLYNLYDRSLGVDDLNGSLNHTQRLGTVSVGLSTQYQQNSYFAGLTKSQSQNTSLSLTRDVGPLTSSLLTTLTQNSFGLGRSQTLTSSLDQTYRPSGTSSLETRFDFSQFNTPSFGGLGGDNRQELDSNLDYRSAGRLVDLELLATKFTQLSSSGGSSQFFGGLERLPEFRVATDALRASFLRRFLPQTTLMDLSLGAFSEPASQTKSQRARFNLDLGTTTRRLNGRSDLDYGGSFQQGVYGDNTAQYVLSGRTAYRLRIGSKSTFGATYTYLRPYGYTPFQFDYAGNTNLAGLNLALQQSNKLRLTVGTGYDFSREGSQFGQRATPFQTVSAQALYAPVDAIRFRTTASYDLNFSRLVDLTNSLRVRGSDQLSLDLAGRFDPRLHRYTTINGDVNLPFFRDLSEDAGYRVRAIGGYNGVTSRFDYKGLALTRSWHDYEASLTYQDTPNGLRPGSTLTLNFRLKAFPAFVPFATGQYGQALDTGIGETL